MEFIRIQNQKTWLIGEIPKFHPDDPRHTQLWRGYKKKCIEGTWERDFDGWRFMPGNVWWYINFGTILHVNKRTKVRYKTRPSLRDLEWERGYMCLEAFGFSGFSNDEYYTSNENVKEKEKLTADEIKELPPECFKGDGQLKTYIEPREYLRKLHSQPLGRPLYDNNAHNTMEFGSRNGGKSFWYSIGINLHELVFDGAKEYNEQSIRKPGKTEVLIGAAVTSKSSEFCSKMKGSMDELATASELGCWGTPDSEDYQPSPFYKDMAGVLKPNNADNPWRHEYQKKVNGRWINGFGSGSKALHVAFTQENPEAAVGTRSARITVEEVGLCFSPETEVRMADLSIKKIKDIQEGDYVLNNTGKPERVIGTIEGKEEMFLVKQNFGDDYIVSKNHILHLNSKYKNYNTHLPRKYECFVQDFNKDKCKSFWKETYGIKNGRLEFITDPLLKINPYILGVWLGDGCVNGARICAGKQSLEMINYIRNIVHKEDLLLSEYKRDETFSSYDIIIKKYNNSIHKLDTVNNQNPIRKALKEYSIFNNKRIPLDYQLATEDKRLELLAGLIDTDGCLVKGNSREHYEFYQTNREELVEDVRLLTKNLGFKATVAKRIVNTGYDSKFIGDRIKYVIRISGDIWRIPVKISYKKATVKRQLKDINSTKISVQSIGIGDYKGIKLENNPLFLLKDGTIVHNCENLLSIAGANDSCQRESNTKFGSTHYLGTAGNIDKVIESRILFTEPRGYDILAYEDEWEHTGEIGFFLPAYYTNNDFKDENGNTDIEAAKAYYFKRRTNAKKVSTQKYDYELMNYPLVPSEMFLGREGRILPITELKERERQLLLHNHYKKLSTPIDIFFDSSKKSGVDYRVIDNIEPIYEFPTKRDANIEGCIVMYEAPIEVNGIVPNDLYDLVGFDPYVSENLEDGESLGAVYVMKNPKYLSYGYGGNEIVCSYVGKHSLGRSRFLENVEKILMMYGSPPQGLWFEADKGDYVKGFFERKNKLHQLCLRPSIEKGTRIIRRPVQEYGWLTGSRTSKIQLLDMLAEWMKEETEINGIKKRNLERLPDIALVRECIAFSLDKGNYDRIMALVGCVLGLREKINQYEDQVRIKHNPLSLLSDNANLFKKRTKRRSLLNQESIRHNNVDNNSYSKEII